MDHEEAALRAKIQAVKNLLQVKQRSAHPHAAGFGSHAKTAPIAASYAPYRSRKPTLPVHKTWTRPGVATPAAATVATVPSANKVWINEHALPKLKPAAAAPPSSQPRHASFAKRVRDRMQLQVLKLEDGEYAKANGGFSLVRSDMIKAKAAATPVLTKRLSLTTGNTASAAVRAQQAVIRARAATRSKSKGTQLRTEYCRFFNKFGYCNNKNECKFLHDSRRVALCRKFAKGLCTDAACPFSHDKNKMPVCMMFLRGMCTRDDCRFRHVKVSGSAQVCEAFVKGYCPKGAACPMKHELPTATPKKRPFSTISNSPDSPTAAAKQPKPSARDDATATDKPGKLSCPTGSPSDATTSTESSPVAAGPAASSSIRPNIRFAPRNQNLMPPLLRLLKKDEPQLPPVENN